MSKQTQEISDLQQLIISNNPIPIRIKGLLRKRKETVEEFLIKFFTDWNLEKETIYTNDSSIQTNSGKRRSLGDIYMICKYYYKDITLNEVLNLLYNVLTKSVETGFRSSYCTTIKKRVWYYLDGSNNQVYNKDQDDEYGNEYNFYLENIVE